MPPPGSAHSLRGDVAQLVERLVRIEEVPGFESPHLHHSFAGGLVTTSLSYGDQLEFESQASDHIRRRLKVVADADIFES